MKATSQRHQDPPCISEVALAALLNLLAKSSGVTHSSWGGPERALSSSRVIPCRQSGEQTCMSRGLFSSSRVLLSEQSQRSSCRSRECFDILIVGAVGGVSVTVGRLPVTPPHVCGRISSITKPSTLHLRWSIALQCVGSCLKHAVSVHSELGDNSKELLRQTRH